MESGLNYAYLCKYCFQVLEAILSDGDFDKISFPEEFKGKSYPLFVTWTTGKEKELRGCVGTFEKDNLEKNLIRYTFISAFKDSRFNPISKDEVKNLNCEVSLLVQFEKAKSPIDWVVGTHGIDIDFKDHKGNSYSATFLPEVAEEEGWDQKTTLQFLIRKAGYRGSLESVYDNIEVTRYQSIKKTISYDEYQKMK
jgi:uncharacterized protein (TIGR00296 family)